MIRDFDNIRPKQMTISQIIKKAKKAYGYVMTDFDTGVYIELKKSDIKKAYDLNNGMGFDIEKFYLDKESGNLYIS